MSNFFPVPLWGNLSPENFRHFVASVSDYAIYMLSPEGIVISWNRGAQRYKGYTPEEILGQDFSRFYTEEDRANGKPVRALKIAVEEGKYEEEGWRVRKDGTHFWASVVIDPVRNDDGQLIGFAKITRDITERREAQEALRASEERFRLLVQGVTDYAIFMLSPAGEITNWNAGAQRIKGYTEDEVVGTHFSRFYTEEDRAKGVPTYALEQAAREGRFETEGWRVRKDGSRFWATVVIDAIYDGLGKLVGFAKVTRDITVRKLAAQELEHAKEALFQSQKLEAIGKLTGGIAHDFNNLLAVIVSGLEMLAGRPLDPRDHKILDSMQRAATRGGNLTQQLLMFARQQPLRQEKHNLNRIITGFDAVLRRVSGESVTFILQLGRQLNSVMVDATQLEAALINLVGNARDATSNGGTLTIFTENVELTHHQVGKLPAGRFVKLTVRDTGSGMPPEVVARAIEPFFTTKPPGVGTGMGLSQVYGLAQQSNGELVIESETGKGTSVSLYLPAVTATCDAAKDEADEPAAGNDKALVVDDQPDVLSTAVALFETMGYDVSSASNGEDALEILQQNPDVDVLFSDVVMPGMSGVELAQSARKLVPSLHILLASGYPGSQLSAENSTLKEFQFISKPYRMTEIVKQLRKAG